MDPPVLMNDGSYNLAEIWQFPTNNSNNGRVSPFGQNLAAQFGDDNSHDLLNLDRRVASATPRGGGGKRRDAVEDDSAAKVVSSCNGNGNRLNDSDAKRLKASGNQDENHDTKTEAEPSSGQHVEQNNTQPPEPPKQDYIHVRARRGQATDSHSLAERARREKISERMKILQDLVPGCNKVIGKALVLDEIINYIQSLQRQVEFLSMKLEAVNSRMPPGIEAFPPKDFGQQAFDTTAMAFSSQATRDYSRGMSPEWLHMQVGGGFERTS